VPSLIVVVKRYDVRMDIEEHLERHLELCRRIFLQMLADGSWPWADSPKSEDLVESEDNPNDP
jgi:hypothetical protein